MHIFGVLNIKKLFNNIASLEYNNLSEEELIGIRFMVESNFERYNTRVLSKITPELFEQFLTENNSLIHKYIDLFFRLSKIGLDDSRPLLDNCCILYDVLVKFILKIDRDLGRKYLLINTLLTKSYDWTFDRLVKHISPYQLYDKNIMETIVTVHEEETAYWLVTRIMLIFKDTGLEFNMKNIDIQLLDRNIFAEFQSKNKLRGWHK
ncbi:MAG: hypothetical protein CMM93_06620 [Rickettsiales bacterium]|nr:hypothetical protein [Rickettsiales bacterium]|tara:strand:+ start:1568 stop:2188 length:621 start_codon:yes stop_codon:yes gene_type:complete